jgi:transposase
MSQALDSPSDWRERRRLRAWALHRQGWSQSAIAREVGVSQSAVSRWFRGVREAGSTEALRRRPAPGKQARLTDEQFAQLPLLLARGTEAYGYPGSRWTTRRVAAVIEQAFGVTYSPSHVSRLLQKHAPDWRNRPKA